MNLDVTVKKGMLLGFLKTNRQKHIDDYEEAVHAYFRELQNKLNELAPQAGARKFRKDNYKINLVRPVNCVERYDKYIGMLEMAEEDLMKISAEQYDCFVDDKWDWAERARVSNSMYK